MRPDSRIHTIIPQQRVGGVTVFGAIGDAVKKPVFWYGKSTTIDEFHKFIPILVDSLTDHAKKVKPYLIIDNHRSHVSKKVMPFLEPHFEVMFFPPHSP